MSILLENSPLFIETHDPKLVRLYYGYTGWTFYQLDFEMLKSIWVLRDIDVPDALSNLNKQADKLVSEIVSQNSVKKEQTF